MRVTFSNNSVNVDVRNTCQMGFPLQVAIIQIKVLASLVHLRKTGFSTQEKPVIYSVVFRLA